MKIKYGIVAIALFVNIALFAQKDELKAAEKAIKNGNAEEAKATLAKIEGIIGSAEDAQKAQYFILKGNASLNLAQKKVDEDKNIEDAEKAYNEVIATESKSGKNKYTADAQKSLLEVKRLLTNSAIVDNDNKRYKESALKLYRAYLMDKKDVALLYYAAGSAINANEYDMALDYYTQLKKLNYSGEATNYTAKSKINDEYQNFPNMKDRDKAVAIGTHSDPKTENVPSKRPEINKNIALILVEKGRIEEAKKAIIEAKELDPNNTSLILTEADLYLKTEDFATYKKLISEVLAKDPNNADLFFNLGVITSKSKDKGTKGEAESYYLKAIQIDPKYRNAYINLAVLKLGDEKELVEKMKKLGNSPAEEKKYQALKVQRQDMYKSVIPFLEKAQELFSDDADIKSTLLGVYNALDMTEKYKAFKAKN
jgi:tetratricopeptide (TPR) repeat protein